MGALVGGALVEGASVGGDGLGPFPLQSPGQSIGHSLKKENVTKFKFIHMKMNNLLTGRLDHLVGFRILSAILRGEHNG